MATATTLPEAAGQSFDNLFPLWVAGGDVFKNQLAAFASQLLPVFPEQDAVGRPIAAWLTIISGLAFKIPAEVAPATVDYNQFFIPGNDYVYRLCWLAAKPSADSPAISTAQQAAILAAYNANF